LIVVGGEALVDLVPAAGRPGAGTVVPGSGGVALLPRLGGGPFNVAVALGRLGAPVGLLSRLSTDAFGEAQLRRLAESAVDTALVQRGPEPTALALATLATDGSARYAFYTAGTATVGFADPGPLPAQVLAVSLGSLGLLLEPGAAGYQAVLHREAAAGRLVALDPNVRPELITDAEAYRARFRSWLPSVGLLKLSVEDGWWLAGASGPAPAVAGAADPASAVVATELSSAVAQWLAAGPRAVVLTSGAGGLTVFGAAGVSVSVPAVPVAVVDTIGAGDTVQAALLARLHAIGGLDLESVDEAGWRDVLGFAARAAAVTCSRPGADPPWAAELRAHGRM